MLEGGNLRWDRAQHCLTEGSLRSPVPVLANFRPLTAFFPLKQHRGGGRSAAPGDPSTFWRAEVIYSMDGFTYSLEIYCFF